MKTCGLLLLVTCLAYTNAIIPTNRKGNISRPSFSTNHVYNAKSQPKKFQTSSENAHKILHTDMEMKNDGSYHYQYETSNGIHQMEKGMGGVAVQGASSYVSPEGVEIKTTYTADENGYHPVGDHIPKIPDYILRALEYIRTHPSKENIDSNVKNKNNDKFIKKSHTVTVPKIAKHIAPPTVKSRIASRNYNNKSPAKTQYNQKQKQKQQRTRY